MDQKSLEKDLLDDIDQLESNKDVQAASEKHPELSKLLSNLKLISQAYHSKLGLYEELEEAKEEADEETESSSDDSKNDEKEKTKQPKS
jgi:capsule polysaccharide export protein KpsE/RkpR